MISSIFAHVNSKQQGVALLKDVFYYCYSPWCQWLLFAPHLFLPSVGLWPLKLLTLFLDEDKRSIENVNSSSSLNAIVGTVHHFDPTQRCLSVHAHHLRHGTPHRRELLFVRNQIEIVDMCRTHLMLIFQSEELNLSRQVTLNQKLVHPKTWEGHVSLTTTILFDYVLVTMEWAVKKSSFRNDILDWWDAALVLVGDDGLAI